MKRFTTKCPKCGEIFPHVCTEDQYARYMNGEPIENVFPDWSAEKREMLITGICPICWNETCEELEEEYEKLLNVYAGHEGFYL